MATEHLRPEAIEHAEGEIRRRKWRGARGGTLPGGVDAEDIVDEAIGDLLGGKMPVEKALSGEPAVTRRVFGCLCEELRMSAEIAKRLGVGRNEVERARRRLIRKIWKAESRKQKS